MNKLEFEGLQRKFNESGMTLKLFLKGEGVAYSTYNYWNNKTKAENSAEAMPMAPITLQLSHEEDPSPHVKGGTGLPGVTLAFPNGVRAHFGSGSEGVLMEVLTKSMGYVLP